MFQNDTNSCSMASTSKYYLVNTYLSTSIFQDVVCVVIKRIDPSAYVHRGSDPLFVVQGISISGTRILGPIVSIHRNENSSIERQNSVKNGPYVGQMSVSCTMFDDITTRTRFRGVELSS